MALETPPPFMANAILNFHFEFLTPSLSFCLREWGKKVTILPYCPRVGIVARGRGALLAAKCCDWGF